MEVAIVLLDGILKNPYGEVSHHLGEDILAFVHNSGLITATNYEQTHKSNRKMSKSYLNNL